MRRRDDRRIRRGWCRCNCLDALRRLVAGRRTRCARTYRAAAYGSDRDGFPLTDHEGNEVGPETLIGRPTMAFFGFTYCHRCLPDHALGHFRLARRFRRRSQTVERGFHHGRSRARYRRGDGRICQLFPPSDPRLTGPEGQIARIADGFRAAYERVPTEGGDYTMNHTASVFLFGAAGPFVTMIDYHEPREFAVPKIRRALEEETEEAT